MGSDLASGAILLRVERLTVAIGAAGTIVAWQRWGWRGAVGLALGAILSWINFRWLKGGVQAFTASATQPSAKPARVPVAAITKFVGRFALLLGVVYVILTRSTLIAAAVFAGLFASAGGVIVGLVYELLRTGSGQGATRSS